MMQKQPNRPVRLRLSSARGFRLQEHSRALNGLPAIVVARPSRWGNPFTVIGARNAGWGGDKTTLLSLCAFRFDRAMRARLPVVSAHVEGLHLLKGHNLACWCPLDCPCHADILLEIANAEAT